MLEISKWYSFDTSDNVGKKLDTITSTVGYTQIIDKHTHFTNHSSSCIDLIFTSNPSIIVIQALKNLSLVAVIMISYMEKVTLESLFHHHTPGLFGIARMLTLQGNFNWKSTFEGKTINKTVQVLSEILKNVLSNFVTHKSLNFNYRQPPWRNLFKKLAKLNIL